VWANVSFSLPSRLKKMKTFLKRFFQFLLFVFIVMQFFRPEKNVSSTLSANDITTKYAIPADVHTSLKTSCYDCHSNNTSYPWYSYIQPVAWYLDNHVKDGKKHFNFNEFASYSIGKQYRKLEEVKGEIEEGEMPMTSYTLIHGDAKLTADQKAGIATWVNTIRDSIKANYPADSLERPKKKA
jgi:Haem-binding domain